MDTQNTFYENRLIHSKVIWDIPQTAVWKLRTRFVQYVSACLTDLWETSEMCSLYTRYNYCTCKLNIFINYQKAYIFDYVTKKVIWWLNTDGQYVILHVNDTFNFQTKFYFWLVWFQFASYCCLLYTSRCV